MSTFEIVLGIASIISISSGIYFSIRGAKKQDVKEVKEESSQSALIMFKLDNIDATVKDIKADSKAFRLDIQDARDRILILEQEYKAMRPMVSDLSRMYFENKEDK